MGSIWRERYKIRGQEPFIFSGRIYRIDLETNTSVVVPDVIVGGVSGLAYNSNDSFLYGVADYTGRIYRIDLETNTSVVVPDVIVGGVSGLAYVPEPTTLCLLALGTLLLKR